MRSFRQWLQEDEEQIKAWLVKHGLRVSLMTIGWTVSLLVVGIFLYLGYRGFDLGLTEIYVPKKYVTAGANLSMLYGPLVLFDFAYGGHAIHAIMNCLKEECSIEDRKYAMQFLSVLAVCSTYLVSIGA